MQTRQRCVGLTTARSFFSYRARTGITMYSMPILRGCLEVIMDIERLAATLSLILSHRYGADVIVRVKEKT